MLLIQLLKVESVKEGVFLLCKQDVASTKDNMARTCNGGRPGRADAHQ